MQRSIYAVYYPQIAITNLLTVISDKSSAGLVTKLTRILASLCDDPEELVGYGSCSSDGKITKESSDYCFESTELN